MKSFIYKTIIVLVGIILLYEFTIGKQVALFKDKFDMLISKEGVEMELIKLEMKFKKQ